MELMKKLFSVSSVAGYETEMKEVIKSEISGFCSSIYEDNIGNLIALCGKDINSHTVINATISDDGLFVTDFKNGIAKCSPIGKIEPEKINGGRFFLDNNCYALAKLEKTKEEKADIADVSFDFLGCDNVNIGDILSPLTSYSEQNGYITGKSAGLKAGIYALINIIKNCGKNNSFTAVFSVKDNLGFKGARAAFTNLNPSQGYIIGTASCDNKTTEISLGKGPAVRLMDKAAVLNKTVLKASLEKLRLDEYQKEIVTDGANMSNRAMYLNNGIPLLNINCPVKYKGTFNETVSINDINQIIDSFCTSI